MTGSSHRPPHSLPPVEQLADGLIRVPIPIPGPLGHVNCYLVAGETGWTVVDTGYHTPEAEQAWQQALAGLSLRFSDIEQVVVTHYHPDHLGAAGWLQQMTGACVWMLDRERPQVERFWKPGSAAGQELQRFFAEHGMPEPVASLLPSLHERLVQWAQPLPAVRWLKPHDTLAVGRRRFQVLWAPGHADGLLVLWEPRERLLVADDLVLDTISPHVGLWPHQAETPLPAFLNSLRQVAALGASLAVTGHRGPVRDVKERARELIEHHHRRLSDTEAAVQTICSRDGGGASAWQVQVALFGEPADLFNARFGMAEALAHLEFLLACGRLRREVSPEGVRYRPA